MTEEEEYAKAGWDSASEKLKFAKESATIFIEVMNKAQTVYTYKYHTEGKYEGQYLKMCNQSGSFHIYDVWSFLDAAGEFLNHLLDKGLLVSTLEVKKRAAT